MIDDSLRSLERAMCERPDDFLAVNQYFDALERAGQGSRESIIDSIIECSAQRIKSVIVGYAARVVFPMTDWWDADGSGVWNDDVTGVYRVMSRQGYFLANLGLGRNPRFYRGVILCPDGIFVSPIVNTHVPIEGTNIEQFRPSFRQREESSFLYLQYGRRAMDLLRRNFVE